MNIIKHHFMRHLCISSVYVDDSGGEEVASSLKCKKCNREIGFIYYDGGGLKTFIHVGYRGYRLEIESWVREHTKDRNYMGNLYEREWGEVLHNIKQWREDSVLSVGCEEWTGECEEDSEGDESEGFGEDNETLEVAMCAI